MPTITGTLYSHAPKGRARTNTINLVVASDGHPYWYKPTHSARKNLRAFLVSRLAEDAGAPVSRAEILDNKFLGVRSVSLGLPLWGKARRHGALRARGLFHPIERPQVTNNDVAEAITGWDFSASWTAGQWPGDRRGNVARASALFACADWLVSDRSHEVLYTTGGALWSSSHGEWLRKSIAPSTPNWLHPGPLTVLTSLDSSALLTAAAFMNTVTAGMVNGLVALTPWPDTEGLAAFIAARAITSAVRINALAADPNWRDTIMNG